jgi:endonuclease/exonuclease/phosphatase family metal-dependent hydrolase
MTIGQTEDNSVSSLEFMISKVRLLPTLDFDIGSLAILVRERTSEKQSANRMRLWGLIDTVLNTSTSTVAMPEYWLNDSVTSSIDQDQDIDEDEVSESTTTFSRAVKPGKTFSFDRSSGQWVKTTSSELSHSPPASLTVSSYNCLVDSEFPPARDRDPLLISTLLSDFARADILVLQEVSDDFLSSLLNNTEIQNMYPFASHAPPSQGDIGPLPSLRNVVVISKWPFRWELVPFHRRHKGAVLAVFDSVVTGASLVVVGIHLTCGLTDGSVAAKKVQVQNLLNHLIRQYSNHPWIITGDFNLATSAYTIDNALKDKSITSQTGNTLVAIEDRLSGDGILDAWSVTRDQQPYRADDTDNNDLFEGEGGATFDPRNNILAAATSGTSQNRPQRYDRILVRPQGALCVTNFNMFGLPTDSNGVNVVPSDHYGVRASMQLPRLTEKLSPDHREILDGLRVELQHVPHLAQEELESTLHRHHMFLTEEEKSKRGAAFALLKEVVLGGLHPGNATAADIPLVMVTVGSFAMKVDTSNSDIDCLCIGSISSKTFFKLARQRLQKAESQGIRILRKVEAGTGTMLELSVNGVPMDLQYCPAARVVER